MRLLRKLIGERIRAIRKQKGITQEELAEKAELMYQYISGVERGTRNISIDSLDRIIQALGIGYDEIFVFGNPASYLLKEENADKAYTLTLHHEMLKERTQAEVYAIHKIALEILNQFEAKGDRKGK